MNSEYATPGALGTKRGLFSNYRMQVTLAHIGAPIRGSDGYGALANSYLARSTSFTRCEGESFRSEAAFFDWLSRRQGRTTALAILLDSRGRQMTSEEFAEWLREVRDSGTQHVVFAIGPADGWTAEGLKHAHMRLALGQFTMAHGLARLVMAEQIYRASTILSGHPYHTGH